MTRNANRDNIEPMFRFVAMPMMVLFCLRRAIMALQSIRPEQSAGSDGMIDSVMSFISFGMTNMVAFCYDFAFFALSITFSCGLAFFCRCITRPGFVTYDLTLFALLVTFLISFAFFALPIFFGILQTTSLAFRKMQVFGFRMFIKFRDWFDLFASMTLFRYDLLRHGRFSLNVKRLCLEPYAPPVGVFGSLYFNVIDQKNNKY